MFKFVCTVPGDYSRPAFVFNNETIQEVAGFAEDYLIGLIKHNLGPDFALEDVEFYELGKQNPLVFEKTVTYTIYQA